MTALLAGLLACTFGPGPLDEWQAEIVSSTRIAYDRDLGAPMLSNGRGTVLVLSTEWGKLPIITDTEQYANLVIALPPDLRPGTTLSAADQAGYLRIGGMSVGYESRHLEGEVRVVEVTREGAALEIDLIAREPVVDLDQQGEKRLEGEVMAVFRDPARQPAAEKR